MTDTSNTQLVVFELDSEELAFPILDVKEILKTIEITPVPDSPDYILGVINIRGKIASIIDMEKKFKLVRESKNSKEHIIIYEDKDGSLSGVIVDKVKGVMSIKNDEIKQPPKMVSSKISGDYAKGVIVQGDLGENQPGHIILILDLPKILSDSNIQGGI